MKNMNPMKKISLLILLVLSSQWSFAQSNAVKIIVSDSTGLINIEMKEIMKGYLSPAGVDNEDYLDFTKRCEYYITDFKPKASDFELSIRNCERELIGKKTIYGEIKLTNKDAMGKALAAEIVAILKSDSSIAQMLKGDGTEQVLVNHHSSRHYFSPSAYNLEKGELYYSTYFGLAHELQYGFTDNFSLGGGTTVGLFPIWVTPKLSFELAEDVRFAVGDLFVSGTYAPFIVNVAYGAITFGSASNNVTFSGGLLNSSFQNMTGSGAVLNFSTMQSFTRYVYLLSENYFVPRGTSTGNQQIFAGFTGVRFIQKKKDVSSFQLGIAYFLLDNGFTDPNFIPLPAVSYTLKFGNKI